MRKTGVFVFLYAFMHAYYGVGALKNASFSEDLPHALALLAGLSWISLLAGSILLILGIGAGRAIARNAAGLTAAVHFSAIVLLWSGPPPDLSSFLFGFLHPVSPAFLFVLLRGLSGGYKDVRLFSRTFGFAAVAAGALMPWIAALLVLFFTGMEMETLLKGSFFLALFMTFWSLLPFVVLLLFTDLWPWAWGKKAAFIGGFLGTLGATLYVYSLIWLQNFNSFIMALLPPVVFAGQAAGAMIGTVVARIVHRDRNL